MEVIMRKTSIYNPNCEFLSVGMAIYDLNPLNAIIKSELKPTCKGQYSCTTCSYYLSLTKLFMYSDAKCFKVPFNE